jgi:hypothetical protein
VSPSQSFLIASWYLHLKASIPPLIQADITLFL